MSAETIAAMVDVYRQQASTVVLRSLTETERGVLQLLLANAPEAVSRAQLERRIDSCNRSRLAAGHDGRVDAHICRLRRKVGAEHIGTIWGYGYRWLP